MGKKGWLSLPKGPEGPEDLNGFKDFKGFKGFKALKKKTLDNTHTKQWTSRHKRLVPA